MSSIFSKIISGEIPSYRISENERFYAFLDIFPLKEAHVLVVPKVEIDKIYDLDDSFLSEMLVFSAPIAKAIEKTVDCSRVGMAVIGLEVPHAHLHLVPINSSADLDFTRPKLKLNPQRMEEIASAIRSHLL